MRRRTATVEQSSLREKKGARADARHTGGGGGEAVNGVDLAWLPHQFHIASYNDKSMGGDAVGRMCIDGNARVADYPAAVPRQYAHVVDLLPCESVRGLERVQWSREIEELVARMDVGRNQSCHVSK